jgi:ADP-heptose:LPS heptosyltransferase
MKVATQISQKLRWIADFVTRHSEALGYALTVLVPLLLRNRRRPVIFARYTGMGDIICSIPAVRQLREKHPGATFIYNCHQSFAETPRIFGVADRVTSIKAIGLVGHWYGFLLAGFYDFAHGDDMPDGGCREPMVAEFCRQFNLTILEEHPEFPINQEARRKALEILDQRNLDAEGLVLIHPGPSWPVREWPNERWAQLVEKLRGHGFTNIGQLGVSRYLNFGKVEVPVIPGATSLVDAFSIEECIAVIAQARLFVGIDSGLLHIAAGTRTPSVGIFGMTLPEYRFSKRFREPFVVNRVPCAGCEHRKPRLHWVTGCPNGIKCMQTLEASGVVKECVALLARDLETANK